MISIHNVLSYLSEHKVGGRTKQQPQNTHKNLLNDLQVNWNLFFFFFLLKQFAFNKVYLSSVNFANCVIILQKCFISWVTLMHITIDNICLFLIHS